MNYSVEHSKGVKVKLQLFDDIANKLKEMQMI